MLIEEDESVFFDGSWSQRRHAKHCFGAFWATKLRKFIGFETISLIGNEEMSSNQLESEILKTLATRNKDDNRIKYFIHDKDSKAYKLVHDVVGWNIEERLDVTHTVKAWKRSFEKMKMLALNGNKRRTNVLGDIEISLLRWFHVSLKLDATFEEKKTHYKLALAHSIQNDKWKFRNDQNCINQLKKYLDDSAGFLDGVVVEQNTQMNESLHSVKGRTAPKITFWKSSWDARTATILHFNEGPKWFIDCYETIVESPLLPHVKSQLMALSQNREKFYNLRNQDDYKEREEIQRIEKRSKYKKGRKPIDK